MGCLNAPAPWYAPYERPGLVQMSVKLVDGVVSGGAMISGETQITRLYIFENSDHVARQMVVFPPSVG